MNPDDSDTTAIVDDEIDVRVNDDSIITIKQSSGDGIINMLIDAKDLQFTQFDGRTKVLEINDGRVCGCWWKL